MQFKHDPDTRADYRQECAEFRVNFKQAFPLAKRTDADSLLRWAEREQRWRELETSVNMSDAERAQGEREAARRTKALTELCERLGTRDASSGDPRGSAIMLCRVEDMDRPRDQVCSGIYVPSLGYTGEELDYLGRDAEKRAQREWADKQLMDKAKAVAESSGKVEYRP